MPDSAVEISSSLSVIEKKELSDRHFRWDSLKKFLYLATAFSHNIYNFDLFSKIFYSVGLFDFIISQVFVGMPYMFMDGFIKQYTRRIDGFKFLNPLLKGISYGLFIQTGFVALLQSAYLADSARFFVSTVKSELPWVQCYGEGTNSTCLSLDEILNGCRVRGVITEMENTAAHYHYKKSFTLLDRGVFTNRCFTIGLIWLLNFFVSTVTDETLVKIYYFVFVFKSVSTLVVVTILLLSIESEPTTALTDIMDYKSSSTFIYSVGHVVYTYGVGFLGFYDFGTMSPYTMIDTAIVIFSIIFTISALVRSWILRILFLRLGTCIKVPRLLLHTHYFYFAVIPLSTEFITAHKLYAFYVYLNVILTTSSYLTMLTLSMAKLLHSEFRSVKIIYLIGLICCCGFGLSLPISVQLTSSMYRLKGYIAGVNVVVPYLGGLKVAIVMWVYGVERFTTDIQFWLGFKTTRYWTLTWRVLPLILLVLMIYNIYKLLVKVFNSVTLIALIWVAVTFLIVTISNIKTISKYLVQNNLASIFTATPKYGPPDPADRRNRRHYSETIQLRRCKHSCQVIDELIDCNHMPLMTSRTESRTSSTESITRDIYRAEGPRSSLKNRSFLDLAHHHF